MMADDDNTNPANSQGSGFDLGEYRTWAVEVEEAKSSAVTVASSAIALAHGLSLATPVSLAVDLILIDPMIDAMVSGPPQVEVVGICYDPGGSHDPAMSHQPQNSVPVTLGGTSEYPGEARHPADGVGGISQWPGGTHLVSSEHSPADTDPSPNASHGGEANACYDPSSSHDGPTASADHDPASGSHDAAAGSVAYDPGSSHDGVTASASHDPSSTHVDVSGAGQ